MADLDEALFSVDGVWNFSASLSYENNTNQLHVGIWGTGETKMHDVQQALEAVFEIRAARESGLLEVVLTMQKGDMSGFSGQAKRMIVDRRLPSD
jgi:hypothetical protein